MWAHRWWQDHGVPSLVINPNPRLLDMGSRASDGLSELLRLLVCAEGTTPTFLGLCGD